MAGEPLPPPRHEPVAEQVPGGQLKVGLPGVRTATNRDAPGLEGRVGDGCSQHPAVSSAGQVPNQAFPDVGFIDRKQPPLILLVGWQQGSVGVEQLSV